MWHRLCRALVKRMPSSVLTNELRSRDWFVCRRAVAEEWYMNGRMEAHVLYGGAKWTPNVIAKMERDDGAD